MLAHYDNHLHCHHNPHNIVIVIIVIVIVIIIVITTTTIIMSISKCVPNLREPMVTTGWSCRPCLHNSYSYTRLFSAPDYLHQIIYNFCPPTLTPDYLHPALAPDYFLQRIIFCARLFTLFKITAASLTSDY